MFMNWKSQQKGLILPKLINRVHTAKTKILNNVLLTEKGQGLRAPGSRQGGVGDVPARCAKAVRDGQVHVSHGAQISAHIVSRACLEGVLGEMKQLHPQPQ